jgi:hypothetical protein
VHGAWPWKSPTAAVWRAVVPQDAGFRAFGSSGPCRALRVALLLKEEEEEALTTEGVMCICHTARMSPRGVCDVVSTWTAVRPKHP